MSRALAFVFAASSNLEPPLQAGRHANQCRAGETVGGCKGSTRCGSARKVIGIMAVSGDGATAGSQIVVGTGPVKRRRDVGVPGQVLAELVLVGCGDHVGLILIGSIAAAAAVRRRQSAVVVLTRITVRAECMRPAKMNAVHWCELLA